MMYKLFIDGKVAHGKKEKLSIGVDITPVGQPI